MSTATMTHLELMPLNEIKKKMFPFTFTQRGLWLFSHLFNA